MKWGVRKDESARVKSARKAYGDAKTKYRKTFDKVDGVEAGHKRQDLRNAKILDKLDSKPKSKTQLRLEKKYLDKGFDPELAAVAAYKNIRTKKILAGIATAAVLAGGAYGANKYAIDNVDRLIRKGTTLQHISTDSSVGVRDAFYSAKSQYDKALYKTKLPGHFGTDSFSKNVKVMENLKIASPKSATKVLQDMVNKDPNFKESLKQALGSDSVASDYHFKGLGRRAIENLEKGIVNKETYEALNVGLVDHRPGTQKVTDIFYKEMTKRGYNAIRDVNDYKYSGYGAKNPIISFGTSGKIKVESVSKLVEEEITKSRNTLNKLKIRDKRLESAKQAGATFVAGSAYVSGLYGTSKKIDSNMQTKAVDKYRSEHPNSKLTYTQIVRMLEKEKVKQS